MKEKDNSEMDRRTLLKTGAVSLAMGAVGAVGLASPGVVLAQAQKSIAGQSSSLGNKGDVVRLGVLNDRSGIYADMGGVGSEVAVKLAVQDFGNKILGKKIEVLGGDTQNKPDVASSLARNWFDTQNLVATIDGGASSTGLAMVQVTMDKGGTALVTGGFADNFTGKQCSSITTQWPPDTYALAKSVVGKASEGGAKKWYFIAPDYVFGRSLVGVSRDFIKESGGTVVGTAFHPLDTTDFAAYLLSAQSSGADVIAFASAGGNLINLIKQASEFGLSKNKKIKLVTYLVEITDVKSMGLKEAQGISFPTMEYWDQNEATREWTKRWQELGHITNPPTTQQVSSYVATLHYLKAVQAAGTFDGIAVNKHMAQMPIVTDLIKNVHIRQEDGRVTYDLLQVVVKSPEESKGPNDLYNIVGVIPADRAFRPLSESECPMTIQKQRG